MIHYRWHWRHSDLHARLRRTAAPTEQPVTLDEVVLHLRLDPGAMNGPEKPLLEGMIDSAVGHLERYRSYAIMRQDWTVMMRDFPPHHVGLELPYPPFTDLLAIIANGIALDVNDFVVEPDERFPATMSPVGGVWPQIIPGPIAVLIGVRCGHEKVENVPQEIKQALLMAVASWYENRESLQQFALYPVVELGWDSLLSAYRQVGFA